MVLLHPLNASQDLPPVLASIGIIQRKRVGKEKNKSHHFWHSFSTSSGWTFFLFSLQIQGQNCTCAPRWEASALRQVGTCWAWACSWAFSHPWGLSTFVFPFESSFAPFACFPGVLLLPRLRHWFRLAEMVQLSSLFPAGISIVLIPWDFLPPPSWESKGPNPPKCHPTQEIAGPNKVLLRETNG